MTLGPSKIAAALRNPPKPEIPAEFKDAYWAWFDAPERERQERAVAELNRIAHEEGELWAIFASAFFHGAEVRRWRRNLIGALQIEIDSGQS